MYTRFIGEPRVKYFDLKSGAYIQDDIRVSKGLTISPGVRFSTQNTVGYPKAWEPSFGMTWAPTPGGKTTLRASAGIFHNFLWWGTYEQTVRVDGVRQRELMIVNPSYPNPGTEGACRRPTNTCSAIIRCPENLRYSAGIDQVFSPQFRVNALYNYSQADGEPSRQQPESAGQRRAARSEVRERHRVGLRCHAAAARAVRERQLQPLAAGPASGRARWNWRRVSGTWSYQWIRARRNSGFGFKVPPTGSLEDEWGNGPGDLPYWLSVNVNSTQLRNLNAGVTWQANDGYPYMLTTGRDNNGDGIINDRPSGKGLWSLRGTDAVDGQRALRIHADARLACRHSARQHPLPHGDVHEREQPDEPRELQRLQRRQTSPFFMQARSVNNPAESTSG